MKVSISVLISLAVRAMATASSPGRWKNQQQSFSVELEHNTPTPAGLPSQNPTRSFWTNSSPDANPLAREGSTGSLTSDADVCIIGSGITGVGVAYHLSETTQTNALQSPLRVVILEARDFCAGATGRNGGNLTPAAFIGFRARAAKYGPEEARRSYALEAYTASSLVRLIREHGWTDDVDLVRGGHYTLLSSEPEAEAAQGDYQAAADAGWPLDNVLTFSKEEVEIAFGLHSPAVKFPAYNLWPPKLVTKLYQLAGSRTGFNLTLHTHTPVTAIRQAGSAPRSSTNATRAYTLSTPRGTIACQRVVHATNGHASHLLPLLAGPQGIFPVRGQVLATRASVSADQIDAGSWSANWGVEYWFARPVKMVDEKPLVILGGARDAARPALEINVDDDSRCHPNVSEALRGFLPAMLNGKFEPGRAPEMEWTGIMGYTANTDPFVGPVDKLSAARGTGAKKYAGQFIAAGYSGHGMPRAFACAEVVSQMIVAELMGTEWIQPEWLPTRYLTWEERGTTVRN